MFELTNHESDASENGNHKHREATDGREGVSHRDFDEETLQKRRKDLADLAIWLSGLKATQQELDNPHDLCDGRAFAELLHEIDKSFFNDAWLETMPEFTSKSNVVVKRSNLRKLWRKMSDYISYTLQRQIVSQRWTDIDERVDGIEETDLPVAVDFGMTVVTLAHIGRNAARFVQYSQEMSAKHQSAIVNVARMIELVMKELPERGAYLDISVDEPTEAREQRVSLQDASAVHENNGNLSARRQSTSNSQSLLQAEIDEILKDKQSLVDEVERLTKTLDALQPNASNSSDTLALLEEQNEELKMKKRQAEERVHELEAELEHIRPNYKEISIENEELRNNVKELQALKNEFLAMEDEILVWKTKAGQLKIEAELGKKREKELKELQGQVKTLNSRLEHHVKRSTDDEDTKAGVMQLRGQIGTLKAMNQDLEIAVVSKERTIRDLEDQLIAQKEKVKTLEDRKDDLITERNQLQDELLLKDQGVTPRTLHESLFDGGNVTYEFFSEKAKLPLEFENKRLLERIEELEALEPLKGEIMKLKSRNGALEEENVVVTKQKVDLERQIEELHEASAKHQQNTSGDVVGLKVQLEKANVEVERMKEAEARAETRIDGLEELVKKRSEQLDELEKALERAKTIIDELEDRSRPVGEHGGTSVQQFKELQEENERLRVKTEKLEIQLETVTTGMEQENRLIASAAHQVTLNRSMDEVMSMRAQGGSDSMEPQTLLETQKMRGALPWRLFLILFTFFVLFIVDASYRAINAPPTA